MKVPGEFIVLLTLSIAVAAVMVVAAYRLYHRYRFPYLLSYLLLIITWFAFGILGMVYSVLAPQVVPSGAYDSISLLNFFHLIPLVFLMLYFFTGFVVGLVEKSLPRVFKLGFGIFVFIFFTLLAFKVSHILSQPGLHSLSSFYLPFPIIRIIKGLFIYGSLVYLFFNLKNLDSTFKGKTLKIIGITFAVGYTFSEICMIGLLPIYDLFVATLITTIVFFGLQVIVFFNLRRFLNRYYSARPLEQTITNGLESFFTKYGISKREGELIQLILKGHSNREIEEALFISLETVKKHIYNIYKKTGVKNRLQLNYLVQNYTNQDT
ncbi:MAG: hypothetical protein GTO45_02260 [Candidatus Aminicenantes bacterium]|nr:hypothetical protein [Candidatus Aminicenantes bacterium]NIM77547.1 hypothetical protein [Candidatus Aminicenantes bacterium]NIN16868.1 hypothetical protein [Candidatus Aminicenantes bacterium]NIN40756.1 hypothetical protein [Candidatus Aminicenantes bacterium]NIN83565.1 hypothetical protein [Candidatus Aminicenantes bacterium]